MALNGAILGGPASFKWGGSLRWYDQDESAYAGVKATATITGSVDYTLPAAPPAADGYVLKSTTAGVMTWEAGGSGTVTIFVDATDRGNVGTGEDDLSTFTLPADTLKNAKDRIVGRAVFKTANNGNVKNMRLYVGSNLIYTISTTLALETFVWDFEIIVDATNSIRVWARSTRNGGVNTTYTTASVTLSSNQTIKFTGEGTSDNDLVQKTMSLQFTPAI